jgi:hypothetical protein
MSAFGGPNIIDDGLVLYLDAGNRKSYPGSGTTWFDKSGRGNNGTLTNGPTFNTGSLGSIVFDGVNDYVDFNNSISNLISTTSTVSFWLYLRESFTPGLPERVLFSSYLNDNNRGVIYFSSDARYEGRLSNLLVEGGSITGRVYTQKSSWDIGWYNIVAIRAPSNYKIYVNGVDMPLTTLANSATKAFPTSSIYNLLSADYYSPPYNIYGFFNGNIGLTQIYNRALSAQEVLQNYNATKGRFGL